HPWVASLDGHPCDVFVGQGQLFHADLVAVGFHRRAGDLDRPGVLELPAGDRGQSLVEHGDGTVRTGALDTAVLDHPAPLADLHAAGDTALEGDVFPLETPTDFHHNPNALFVNNLVFNYLVL